MQDLIDYFGSQYRLAKALGVTKSAVSQWFTDGQIPPARAIQIEELSNGKFKAVELTGGRNGNFSAK